MEPAARRRATLSMTPRVKSVILMLRIVRPVSTEVLARRKHCAAERIGEVHAGSAGCPSGGSTSLRRLGGIED
jgi:hypothetical protein